MRKLIAGIVFIFCLSGIACADVSWYAFAKLDDGIYYLDTNSVKDNGESISVWTRQILRGETLQKARDAVKSNDVYSFVSLFVISRNGKSLKNFSTAICDKNGKALHFWNDPVDLGKLQPVIPNSIGAQIVQLAFGVLGRQKTNP